jgi:hypothetical protein
LERRSLQEEELVRKAAEIVMRVKEIAGEKDDAHDPETKEATEAQPATQLKTDKHRFRLRGIRSRQLAGCQTKTTQYRVVWGTSQTGLILGQRRRSADVKVAGGLRTILSGLGPTACCAIATKRRFCGSRAIRERDREYCS